MEGKVVDLPDYFVPPGASTRLSFKKGVAQTHTSQALVIEGNRPGFFALANVLLSLLFVEESFQTADIPGLTSEDGSSLYVRFDDDASGDGRIRRTGDRRFEWRISEEAFALIAGVQIHALGYESSFNSVNVDDGMTEDEISIYCEVTE